MRLSKEILAEFMGTAGLLIVVVGSGIMGENLSQGNAALALLANSIATGAGLYALIQTFGDVSGAHLNPVVSLFEFFKKRLSLFQLIQYGIAQTIGAVVGVLITHAMFGQEIVQLSTNDRGDSRFFLSEMIATFGLLTVISLSGRKNSKATPSAIALYITAAYWCTSSTSFANPAASIARSLTNSFSGILWTGVPGFIAAQALGTCLAFWISLKIRGTRQSGK